MLYVFLFLFEGIILSHNHMLLFQHNLGTLKIETIL